MIPIKFKKRMFETHRDLWKEALLTAVPNTDLGRGQTTSSMIPNLGHSLIQHYLLQRYQRKFCIFTNCATDALDLVVRALDFPLWYVPSYTWVSAVNAIAKAGAAIRFLDVDFHTRLLSYADYDPRYPIIVPHVDGLVAPPPPQRQSFVLEDAAQSPISAGNNFGDATVLSFGSSKRLGLLGQGGCILTDDESLAERLLRLSIFGLNAERKLIEPGDKTFLDPFNALCTHAIYHLYETKPYLARIDAIIDYYNAAADIKLAHGLERYTIKVKDRKRFRTDLAEVGIESRVWLEDHSAHWPFYQKYAPQKLVMSDLVTDSSVDIPLNEYLSDAEVEKIASTLKKLRPYLWRDAPRLS